MQASFEGKLEKYAELIVKVGVNLQPGQRLLIGPPIYGYLGTELEAAPLVRLIAAKAYQAGARLVEVIWRDDQLKLIRLQGAPRDSFKEYPTWRAEAAIEAAGRGDALLFIASEDQALFIGQDPALMEEACATGMKHMKPFLELRGKKAMNFAYAAAPVQGWADFVFPDLPPQERLPRLWEKVFEVCRVNQPDPLEAWKAHVAQLTARKEYLNRKAYPELHFRAPGTDLRMNLPEGHIWVSGSLTSRSGIEHVANIPTEEIFTLPHKDRVNGVVTLSIPYQAQAGLVDKMRLVFSEGKVVEYSAEQGEDIVGAWLEMDEGVKHLGEVALVPHSSPISQSGTTFYDVLFDENASCHLALGNAYQFCLAGGEEMSAEEFSRAGGNSSADHIDFMIGSEKMDVDGIQADGSAEPILRGGEWAFEA